MRRTFLLLLALVGTGCARRVYSAPVLVGTSSRVVRAEAAAPRREVSTTDAVEYLLAAGMAIPVAGATTSQLRDTFDEGRDAGRVHRALDILAPRGTAVLAADNGQILRVSSNTLGGNIIYASDPLRRVVYYYAHLDAYRSGLFAGATIARGDTLGFVGTTGNAPKGTPHLHFQVMRMPSDGKYWDGEPINPYPLLLLTHDARP